MYSSTASATTASTIATATQISTQRGYQRREAGSTRVASRSSAPGSKRSISCAGVQGSGASRRPALKASRPDDRPRIGAGFAQLRQAHRSVALGQALAVVAEHQRDVRVAGHRSEPEQLVEPDLACRRGEQIGSAHDVADALVRVVDHDGQLVGDDAVAPAHHDVARRRLEHLALRPHDVVAELDLAVHAHAQRGRAPGRDASRALGRREVAAGARVERAVGAVRRGGGPRARRRASRSTRRGRRARAASPSAAS